MTDRPAFIDPQTDWVECFICGQVIEDMTRVEGLDVSPPEEYYPDMRPVCPDCDRELIDDDDDPTVVTDGGRSGRTLTRYRAGGPHPSVSYGPVGDGDEWVLAVTTESEGRVEIVLGERLMYDLWTEVRNVPWPNAAHHTEERGRLVRQVVHAANDAGEEMLRDALEALGVRDA